MAAAVSGCATLPQDEAAKMMQGRTRAEVLACAGAPFREAQDGDFRVMSYSHARGIDGRLYQCELNIMLRAGAVETVRYTGPPNTCAAILRSCK